MDSAISLRSDGMSHVLNIVAIDDLGLEIVIAFCSLSLIDLKFVSALVRYEFITSLNPRPTITSLISFIALLLSSRIPEEVVGSGTRCM